MHAVSAPHIELSVSTDEIAPSTPPFDFLCFLFCSLARWRGDGGGVAFTTLTMHFDRCCDYSGGCVDCERGCRRGGV